LRRCRGPPSFRPRGSPCPASRCVIFIFLALAAIFGAPTPANNRLAALGTSVNRSRLPSLRRHAGRIAEQLPRARLVMPSSGMDRRHPLARLRQRARRNALCFAGRNDFADWVWSAITEQLEQQPMRGRQFFRSQIHVITKEPVRHAPGIARAAKLDLPELPPHRRGQCSQGAEKSRPLEFDNRSIAVGEVAIW
jgi:hypothetical protein